MKPMKDSAIEHAIASKKEILGKVKELGTEIELVLDNKVFTAELLWLCAPKTCEAVARALPLDSAKTVDGGVIHSCIFGWTMLARWPKTAVSFAVPPDNHQILLKEGYLYWQTYDEPLRDERFEASLNEMAICYRAGYGWSGPQGIHALNEFAMIKDKLDELAAIGNDLYSKSGQKTLKIRRKK